MSHSTLYGYARRLLACAVASLLSVAEAGTLTVPGSSPTIQGAIGMAASGDTILVSPGTYPESINFLGKNLTLRSTDGPSVTTITAPATAPVVQFVTNETSDAVLDGFTIRGGNPAFVAPYFGDGGGIFVSSASPTISNNHVTGNVANSGGGIQSMFGSPRIVGNAFSANLAHNWGGGVSVQGVGTAVIENNSFDGNTAGSGSAIGFFAAGTPRVADNIMTNNLATDSDCRLNGGTIWMVNQSDADVEQNVIANNPAACSGGIVFLVPSGDRGPAVVNNTIALNGGSASSGIYAEGFDATTRLVNNIVVGPPGSTAMGCGSIYATSPPVMHNNVLWSEGGVAASGFCAAQIGINGNVSADPQFASPATGNFRLQPGSVAIDAGLNSEPLLVADDFAGAPRIQDGNGDDVAIVDMGAFEAGPPPLAPATPVPTNTWPWLAALAIMMSAMGARSARRSR